MEFSQGIFTVFSGKSSTDFHVSIGLSNLYSSATSDLNLINVEEIFSEIFRDFHQFLSNFHGLKDWKFLWKFCFLSLIEEKISLQISKFLMNWISLNLSP